MSTRHGSFVWYELMTVDAPSAEAFYRRVVGWEAVPAPPSGTPYTLFQTKGTPVAGLFVLPESIQKAGARPAWVGYIAVEDVDRSAGQVTALGGVIHRPPEDIPGVGRFAVAADPQGAIFVLFRGSSDMPAAPPMIETPGYIGWRELMTADREAGFDFYAKLFGWTKSAAIDLGEWGTYQLFAIGEETVGGMMTKQPEIPVSYWSYYLRVESVTAAVERVQSGGGVILAGPREVPGGQWIIQGTDPQGAVFALVSAKA
jgi:predicted enzyme related to lactoylglutathione lyase